MTKSIYISGTDASSGKFMTSLGVLQSLLLKTPKVAYFRPIIPDDGSTRIETVINYFSLTQNYEACYALTAKQVTKLQKEKKHDLIINKIFEKHRQLEKDYDYVVVEGLDFLSNNLSSEFDLNAQIPQSLGLPVILVVNSIDKEPEDLINDVQIEIDGFLNKNCDLWSVIINKVNPSIVKELNDSLHDKFSNIDISIIPFQKKLTNPSLSEILIATQAKQINDLSIENKLAKHILVGGMLLENYLAHFTQEETFLVVAGDRSDIILGTIQAHLSEDYPTITGILLCGGFLPGKQVLKLIKGINTIPLFSTHKNVFESTQTIHHIESKTRTGDIEKIESSIKMFTNHVSFDGIQNKLSNYKIESFTPRMFQHLIVQKAISDPKHIVLPEGMDARILEAAHQVTAQNLATLTILGDPEEVKERYQKIGIAPDYDKIQIIDPCTSEKLDEYAETLYELRKDKGLVLRQAKDLMMDVSYYGTMMVYRGHADGMVSGAAHTTQHTIRPALQFIKTKPGYNTVSSIFFMLLPDKVAVYGDCAVVPDPTAEQLADIAINAAETASQFAIQPKVAMLSYSSGNSGSGHAVDKVRVATQLVKEKQPDIKIEGPIQYDAAVDPDVGQKKMPGSEVAGNANVLIFPDLNTGNNTYKAVQRAGNVLAIGPVLQGLRKPINDLSRGANIDDIINTIIITAIQAQNITNTCKYLF